MNTFDGVRNRPWLATTAAAAFVTVVLLFVPVSFDRTIGHEVTVDVSGAALDRARVSEVAGELRGLLSADRMSVRALEPSGEPGRDRFRIRARVGDRSRGRLERLAASFAAGLAERGLSVDVSVAPLKERISNNILSAAANSLVTLRIETEGRSEADVADDLRSQLEEAGFTDPDVAVDLDGECRKISIQVEGNAEEDLPEIQCEDDFGGEPERIMIRRTPEMTDAEVAAEVERQLRELGLEGTVTIDSDGRVVIDGEPCNEP